MGHRWKSLIFTNTFTGNRNMNCVEGGQGSPQKSGPEVGPHETLGSSMNRSVLLPAGSRSGYIGSLGPLLRIGAFRVALFGLLALSSATLRAESANSMYKHAQAAEAREDYDTAFDLYQKAAAKAPKDLTYKTAL